MPSPKRKSIVDIISKKGLTKKPSVEEIEKITHKIHQSVAKPLPEVEKIKRISINAPVSLYLKAKTKSTLKDQTLMAYIIDLIEADVR